MSSSIAVVAGTGNVQVTTGSATLVGVSYRETAAAVATFVIRDGTTTGDPIKFVANVAASGSSVTMLPAIVFTTGVFLHRGTGTTELVLHFQ